MKITLKYVLLIVFENNYLYFNEKVKDIDFDILNLMLKYKINCYLFQIL